MQVLLCQRPAERHPSNQRSSTRGRSRSRQWQEPEYPEQMDSSVWPVLRQEREGDSPAPYGYAKGDGWPAGSRYASQHDVEGVPNASAAQDHYRPATKDQRSNQSSSKLNKSELQSKAPSKQGPSQLKRPSSAHPKSYLNQRGPKLESGLK